MLDLTPAFRMQPKTPPPIWTQNENAIKQALPRQSRNPTNYANNLPQ